MGGLESLSGETMQMLLIAAVVILAVLFVMMVKLSADIKKLTGGIGDRQPETAPSAMQPVMVAEVTDDSIEPRIIAVITASVYAYMQASGSSSGSSGGFTVRSIRRADTWNNTARKENVLRR